MRGRGRRGGQARRRRARPELPVEVPSPSETALGTSAPPLSRRNPHGTAQFRETFRPYLLSPSIVRLTKDRIRRSAGFHLKMVQQCFGAPGQFRQDDAGGVVNVFIGGGLTLRYGPGVDGGNGRVLEAALASGPPARRPDA